MPIAQDALAFVVVALLWGATNPFIARASKKKTEGTTVLGTRLGVIGEWVAHLLDWEYSIPFVLNQCGSVVFYYTLSHADVSIAVPVCNSLTFVFTALSGALLGEKLGSLPETCLGMALVVLGVYVCISS